MSSRVLTQKQMTILVIALTYRWSDKSKQRHRFVTTAKKLASFAKWFM